MIHFTDEGMQTAALAFGLVLTIILVAEALRRVAVKPMSTMLKKVRVFLDDWAGEPEHEGFPARAGVMTRLSQTDAVIDKIETSTERTEWHVGNGNTTRLRTIVEDTAKQAKTADERAAAAANHAATVEKKADDTHKLASQNAEAISKLVKDLSPILRRYQRRQAEGYDDTSEDGL